MAKIIGVEVFCNACGGETRYEDEQAAEFENYGVTHRCAYCGNTDINTLSLYRSPFRICGCGTTVYLDKNSILPDGTVECEGCGQIYNAFGDRLKDRSEWEEDY